jgi:hypothetical protein
MSKEKQIEEMAKTMLEESQKANVEPVLEMEGKEVVLGENATKVLNNILEQAFIPFLAEVLYNAGYHKQSEWISVDERLPEDEQMVLTIDTESEMQVCFYETALKGIFQQCHGLVHIYNITHWMPLPEAPKMKGGAE